MKPQFEHTYMYKEQNNASDEEINCIMDNDMSQFILRIRNIIKI
jgi:hypothetical protein